MLGLLSELRACHSSTRYILRCIVFSPSLTPSSSPDMGAPKPSDDILAHGTAKDCKEPMGWTSENVSNDFGVTREEMDQWAAQYVSSSRGCEVINIIVR